MPKLELKIDAREVWAAYADRLYSGDKFVKSITEMLQNSVDAESREVQITIEKKAEKHYIIYFKDNGCGMDTYTFLNRFLCLGGHAQENRGKDKTGGNGVAKAIILFNKHVVDFWIDSTAKGQHFLVTMSDILNGKELTSRKTHNSSGVVFMIEYRAPENIYFPGPDISKIKRMLSFAVVPNTKIVLNGEEIECCLKKSDLHSALIDHHVYIPTTTDSYDYRRSLVVLSNGLPQFADYIAHEGTFVINFRSTTYADFTPSREKVITPELKKAIERLQERLTYEHENPITSKLEKPKSGVKRRTFNLKKRKTPKQQKDAPESVVVGYESPIMSDVRHINPELQSVATQRTEAGIIQLDDRPVFNDETLPPEERPQMSDEERELRRIAKIFEELVPSRGIIIDNRIDAEQWHPEEETKFRRVIVLMDRFIELLEYKFGIEVANIGIMQDDRVEGCWQDDDAAVLVNTKKLNMLDQRIWSHQLLYLLTHELPHYKYASHTEPFSLLQADMLSHIAMNWDDFEHERKQITKIY